MNLNERLAAGLKIRDLERSAVDCINIHYAGQKLTPFHPWYAEWEENLVEYEVLRTELLRRGRTQVQDPVCGIMYSLFPMTTATSVGVPVEVEA